MAVATGCFYEVDLKPGNELLIRLLEPWDVTMHFGYVHHIAETTQAVHCIVLNDTASTERQFHEDYSTIPDDLVKHCRQIWNSAKEAAKTAAETARIEEDLAILRDRGTIPLPPAGSDLLPTKLEESIWQRAQEAEVTEDEIILSDMAFFALPTRYVPITPPIPDLSYNGYMFSGWTNKQFLAYCCKCQKYSYYSLHYKYEEDLDKGRIEDYLLARKLWCDMQEYA
ncbi:hypothetical protein BT96DRAFT_1001689 [Gymnopus androsaceus JB14]|uniref:Uncharacterized protein n=1 Tax=Gymnopus androsaceus JB14 TaxID=1447944 RepID=A0A6A4H0A8_9AGAR|nr:hypothetical protein BT96DRAFT_1001689 [Gymnopus androsaceus JB14]